MEGRFTNTIISKIAINRELDDRMWYNQKNILKSEQQGVASSMLKFLNKIAIKMTYPKKKYLQFSLLN